MAFNSRSVGSSRISNAGLSTYKSASAVHYAGASNVSGSYSASMIRAAPVSLPTTSTLAASYAAPMTSTYAAPMASSYAAPLASAYSAPMTSSYAATTASTYAAPLASTYAAPRSSTYAAPATYATAQYAAPLSATYAAPYATAAPYASLPITSPRAPAAVTSVGASVGATYLSPTTILGNDKVVLNGASVVQDYSYAYATPAQVVTLAAPGREAGSRPLLDAAFEDEDAFIRFVKNACTSDTSAEHRELYGFLLECFVEADTDFDGLVGPDRFDYMIERAAALPRKWGAAPSEAESFESADHRRAFRNDEFNKIDTDGSGNITFEEWYAWANDHIHGKALLIDPKVAASAISPMNTDPGYFQDFVIAASRTRASKEYKELYHFLQTCFTDADKDFKGRIEPNDFDQMIEIAAAQPRRFGFAPSASAMYQNDADRLEARIQLFAQIDVGNKGWIGFSDWLSYCYGHIVEKATLLDPSLASA